MFRPQVYWGNITKINYCIQVLDSISFSKNLFIILLCLFQTTWSSVTLIQCDGHLFLNTILTTTSYYYDPIWCLFIYKQLSFKHNIALPWSKMMTIYWIKYVFSLWTSMSNWNSSMSETLIMNRYNSFNSIMLICLTFQTCFLLTLKRECVKYISC